jgi:hypothetical protein
MSIDRRNFIKKIGQGVIGVSAFGTLAEWIL